MLGLPGEARADAVSNAVGVVRVATPAGTTIAVANPFPGEPAEADGGETARQLLESSDSTDRLHVWLGPHFTTYVSAAGRWRIPGTAEAAPDERLAGGGTAAFLVTRVSPVDGHVALVGPVPGPAGRVLKLPPASWSLIGCPVPRACDLAVLTAAGARINDEVKVWDAATRQWVSYVKTYSGWHGPNGGNATIPIGTAFLYYNFSSEPRSLSFASGTRER